MVEKALRVEICQQLSGYKNESEEFLDIWQNMGLIIMTQKWIINLYNIYYHKISPTEKTFKSQDLANGAIRMEFLEPTTTINS